jgi:glutamine synthetase
MLNNVHGEAATVAWKELVRSIASQLTAMGIPHEEIRHQVMVFQDSVQQELQSIGQTMAG